MLIIYSIKYSVKNIFNDLTVRTRANSPYDTFHLQWKEMLPILASYRQNQLFDLSNS